MMKMISRVGSLTAEQPSSQTEESGATPTPTLHLIPTPRVGLITLPQANLLLKAHHYLGAVRSASVCLGHEEGATVWGVMRSLTWHKRLKEAGFNPIELIRMVGIPGHQWATSSLLSNSVKCLKIESKFDCFVTYADPMAGHTGNVYRAANWKRLEDAQPDGFVWRLDGKVVSRKRFFAKLGTSAIEVIKGIYGDRLVLTPDVPKRRFALLKDWKQLGTFLIATKKIKSWGKNRTAAHYCK